MLGFNTVRDIAVSVALIDAFLAGGVRERVAAEMARCFHGAVHVLPQEGLEAAHGNDFVLRVDGEAVLAGEIAETVRIVAARHHTVVVQIEAGGKTGIGVGRVAIRILDARRRAAHRIAVGGRQEVVLEQLRRIAGIACAHGRRRVRAGR